MHMWVSIFIDVNTLFHFGKMDFGKVFMLCLSKLIHAVYIFYITFVALDEGFLVVHDVLVWRLFQSEYLYRPKVLVLDVLNKL